MGFNSDHPDFEYNPIIPNLLSGVITTIPGIFYVLGCGLIFPIALCKENFGMLLL